MNSIRGRPGSRATLLVISKRHECRIALKKNFCNTSLSISNSLLDYTMWQNATRQVAHMRYVITDYYQIALVSN